MCRYVKFDTFHPAVDIGLPVTRVISRVTLQRKLAEKAEELEGKGVLCNDCHVVDYEEVRHSRQPASNKYCWFILAHRIKASVPSQQFGSVCWLDTTCHMKTWFLSDEALVCKHLMTHFASSYHQLHRLKTWVKQRRWLSLI